MIDNQAATNTSQRTKMAKHLLKRTIPMIGRRLMPRDRIPPHQPRRRLQNNNAGFSRLLVIWGITFIAILICLGVTLFLIERSKQVVMPIAPPLLPTAANPSDTPPEPQEVNLFLLDTTTLKLVPIKTERRLHRELRPRLSQVVKALIQETPPNFRNTIPRGTELNEVYIDSQQTAYLDFSSHLSDGHIGGTTAEFLTVTAILKTVFDAFPDDIKQVQILIDGEEVKTIAGHLNLSQPLRLPQ